MSRKKKKPAKVEREDLWAARIITASYAIPAICTFILGKTGEASLMAILALSMVIAGCGNSCDTREKTPRSWTDCAPNHDRKFENAS